MSEATPDTFVTAGFLVIGDEILSGRTKDKNIGFLADYLTAIGIDLKEVRVVPDETDEIVAAVNALRAKHTYVFTSGGIGPTHDDITADSIAAAFGVTIDIDPRARAILAAHYPEGQLTDARLRMARIPDGADLIENPVSKAPGFRIGNVHVMAGVPAIMQAMMDAIAPTLKTGKKLMSRTVDADVPESRVADRIRAIQENYPETLIGSYPRTNDGRFTTQIVIRARDEAQLEMATSAVETAVREVTA
ncbi:molybdenum cofactor synthesis domain-containing protein [Roseibium hamelinense]|uniref:Molybdenum cofactor synthesis domain-containing protein n=1 Tax=Roseibium hamelinense TaxID=150831 RepID=A0A562T9Z5_9HYPH|nr:molybdopterin-binding protein [Roseibium hamelinense]MTI45114.1 competence/damage-inducible protein A [Roseibium hamelinense]TWI90527.1 molybdenum cofactor synthesis domain-containing protein [Roseibium hamelinense]